MTTISNTPLKGDGTAAPQASVFIDVVGPNGDEIRATDGGSPVVPVRVAASGAWSVDLTPNASLTPVGTRYRVVERVKGEKARIAFVVVPASGGPYNVGQLGSPVAWASAWGAAPGDAGFEPSSGDGHVFEQGTNSGFSVGIEVSPDTIVEGQAAGSFGVGYAYGGTAMVRASGLGSFAHGFSYQGGVVQASQRGSFAGGRTWYAKSRVFSNAVGAMARGEARNHSGGAQNCWIVGQGPGSFSTGYARGHSTIETIISTYGQGAVSFGSAYAAQIKGSSHGSLTHGYAYGGGGLIHGYGRGSHAHGYVTGAGSILRAQNDGSHAHGRANAGRTLIANATGAHAGGFARDANISATGHGSFAHGYAKANAMSVTGKGSAVFGYAQGADIIASANNAFQFGPGTNSIANSLQVGAAGAGVHLHGGGAPGAPVNGDIWLDGSGNVMVRTGGASKNLSNVT